MKNTIQAIQEADKESEASYNMICNETTQDIKEAMYFTDGLIIY